MSSELKGKAKTLRVGVVPWKTWKNSPAYKQLSPEKKVRSLEITLGRTEKRLEDAEQQIQMQKNDFIDHISKLNDKFREIEGRLNQARQLIKEFPSWDSRYTNNKPDLKLFNAKQIDDWLKHLKRLLGVLGEKTPLPMQRPLLKNEDPYNKMSSTEQVQHDEQNMEVQPKTEGSE